MNSRHVILFALGLALPACGSAVESESGPELPRVAASELTRAEVEGPSLHCAVEAGQLACELSSNPDFRVAMASILVQSGTHVEEHGFFGDVEVAQLTNGAVALTQMPAYPVSVDIQFHYSATAIEGPDGTMKSDASVRCQINIASANQADMRCDAGTYERWNVYLVPDSELVAAWTAERFGTASVQATVVSEAQDPSSVCFRNYPDCGEEGLVELWDEVPDESGEIPDAIRYSFLLPRDAATSSVSITTNVMYSPTPLDGPGIYVVGAEGQVVLQ